MTTTADPDLVGIHEIATRLGVKRSTVDQWRHRDVLLAPRWVVSGTPVWDWPEVEAWAEATGRPPGALRQGRWVSPASARRGR